MDGDTRSQRIDHALQYWAQTQPQKTAITYLVGDCVVDSSYTYEKLDFEARKIAGLLLKQNREGQRAVLLNRGDIHFVASFFGCIYANVIPVPVSKPQRRINQWKKLEKIIEDCDASIIMGAGDELASLSEWLDGSKILSAPTRIAIDQLDDTLIESFRYDQGVTTDIAFLQYTSGSTGDPKGVVVSHSNLIHNEQQLEQAFEHTNDTVNVSWLPLFHDMGLIGCLLQSIYIGGAFYFMTPVNFLQKPFRWLQMISKYQAETSGAPNFAYDLCSKRVTAEDLAELDLSHWKLAFNGSEPVKARSLREFSKCFASCGFSAEAFYPCYGLAEGTLFSTGGRKTEAFKSLSIDAEKLKHGIIDVTNGDVKSAEYVSLGATYGDQDLAIVSASGKKVKDGEVGEIWLRGNSVAQGYWERPEQSQQAFGNYLFEEKSPLEEKTLAYENMEPSGPYFKTGDLGFMLDGQLYFTGRLKELIIIRGRNYYPNDIETAIQDQISTVRRGCGAAFTVELDDEDKLIVVQELDRQTFRLCSPEDVIEQVKKVVSAEFNLSVYDVVLINPGQLPKTSSGKIQRKECARMYIEGEWQSLIEGAAEQKTSDPTAFQSVVQTLVFALAKMVNKAPEEIDIQKSMSAYGLDSLQVIQIQQQIAKQNTVHIEIDDMFSDDSIDLLCRTRTTPIKADTQKINTSNSLQSLPLTANQHALWFLSQLAPENCAYNLPFAFRLTEQYASSDVARALQQAIEDNFIARIRIEQDAEQQPVQLLAYEPASVELIDARMWSEAEIDAFVVEHGRHSFYLNGNPLINAKVLTTVKGPVVCVVVHHVISDLWSHVLLLKGFLKRLQAKEIQAQTHWAYFNYVQEQQLYLQSPKAEEDLNYWLKHLGEKLILPTIPKTALGKINTEKNNEKDVASFDFCLPAHLADALRQLAKSQGCTLNVILTASFCAFLHRLCGQKDIVIGIPTVGQRDNTYNDCSGYFVNPIIYRSQLSKEDTLAAFVSQSKQRLIASLKHGQLPIQKIIENSQFNRDALPAGLFNVMFSYNSNPDLLDCGKLILGQSNGFFRIEDVDIETLKVPAPGAQVDLSLILSDSHDRSINARFVYSPELYSEQTIFWWAESLQSLFQNLCDDGEIKPAQCAILNAPLMDRLNARWQGQEMAIEESWSIPAAFSQMAASMAEKVAVSCGDTTVSFMELDKQSRDIAACLMAQGVNRGMRVGVYMHKSVDTVLCMMAIMRAGAAYVPLDPEYPASRLSYIAEDAQLALIIEQGVHKLQTKIKIVDFSSLRDSVVHCTSESAQLDLRCDDVAYLIYTSGSTGQPKGVPITHGNVCNLFLGLDQLLPGRSEDGSKMFSLTSISFDISVLELFWSLTRGLEVVLPKAHSPAMKKSTAISIMYFNADENAVGDDHYELLLEGAKTADRLGFDSVWVPERHFHAFGGTFPNPSVLGSAVACVTQNIKIRAGSVVLPLHNPIRVAEEWAVVDRLSKGRVGIAFASGWHPNDFVLATEKFENRRKDLFDDIVKIHSLWRGEALTVNNGIGEKVDIVTRPRPVQKELPTWITAAGSAETFEKAGAMGANILTHMLGQNIDQLQEKIGAYKRARKAAGFDENTCCVTVMLHTYVCQDEMKAKAVVEEPFKNYLRSSVELMRPIAEGLGLDPEENKELIVQHAFDRFYSTSALFGTPERCQKMVDQLVDIGVTEIACLIDFGVSTQEVLEGLPVLAELMKPEVVKSTLINSLSDLDFLENITHLQCTPSYLNLLLSMSGGPSLLKNLDALLIGGEPVPAKLVEQLHHVGCDNIFNMYGPTETTVWSAVSPVTTQRGGYAPIDGPIANTQLYVIDAYGNLLPPGFEGELCIAGEGLSLGYWQQQQKTAEAFVANPFRVGEVMYKTGDIVRQAYEGGLTFLSRKDSQCKIGGNRIELGEIEHHLQQCEGVHSAAVSVIRDNDEQPRLVGFVVGEHCNSDVIKQRLRKGLPEYMVPSSFVRADTLPSTPNGKLDRKALPALFLKLKDAQPLSLPQTNLKQSLLHMSHMHTTGSLENGEVQKPYVVPDSVEARVIQVWRSLLSVGEITVHTNFFEIGGHSLMLPKVKIALEQEFDITIEMVDLLQNPTVGKLSSYLQRDSQTASLEKIKQDVTDRSNKRKSAMKRMKLQKSDSSYV